MEELPPDAAGAKGHKRRELGSENIPINNNCKLQKTNETVKNAASLRKNSLESSNIFVENTLNSTKFSDIKFLDNGRVILLDHG